MRVWHFIAYAYIFSFNMHGHEASMARCLFFLMCLYLHPFFLCVEGGGDGKGSDETFCMRCYV